MTAPRRPKVFISRTTAGLKPLADEIAGILRQRGAEPVVQSDFLPDWRTVPQMLQDKLIACDSMIALIGPVHGGEPAREPARLKDPRTHGRTFSFTQWEFLVARDLGRPMFTFIVSGDDMVAPFEKESAVLVQRQQQFIAEFPGDRTTLFYEYTDRQKLLDHIRGMELPLTAFAGKPSNIPYASLGTLFKGRDEFLAELRNHLTAEAATVIKGHRTIHGMGGVGKTRAAIEYAWKHADDYNALLFVSADSAQALQRNLANLCGPLVLNLPEQSEKDQNLQFEAALKWLALHSGWFLIIDNVDTADAAEETKALLQRLSAGHVVITSRLSDWTGQVTALDLDVLSDAAAIEFLNERTAERRAKQSDDDAIVPRLVRVLDCLALALEQAGALISHERLSYAHYLEMWESARTTVLAWHDEEKMKYPRSLAATYETSVSQLSSAAKAFFWELSWLAPDPLPRSTLESLPDPADARRHLSELDHLHLVRFRGDGQSFTVHRLVQEITRQRQGTVSKAAPNEKNAHEPWRFFSRLFGKSESPPRPKSGTPVPLALVSALQWMNGLFSVEAQDVRTWTITAPLTSHAQAVASFADGYAIPDPTTRLMNQVALLLDAKAQYHSAEPLCRRALTIDEVNFGKDHPRVATDLGNLAHSLYSTNRLAEAEPLMRRALAIDEASYGKNDPSVAIRLNNLVTLLHATNRLVEAEPLMRRALAIDEASYGRNNPRVATDLNTLAQLLDATNRLDEAEPLMRRALAIDEASYGEDHPKVAIRLNNFAQLLQDTNRLTEAEPLMRRALAIDEASYGKDHPNVAIKLNNLARLLKYTKRIAEAEPLYRRALAIDEASYGKDHPVVAIRVNNLARLLQDTNRLTEAEPLMRRALAIDEASYGKNDPNVALSLNNLARLLQDTNRLAEAEPLMRRLVLILLRFTQQTGYSHPHLYNALDNYDVLLEEKGEEAMGPAIRSLGAEAGLPMAEFQEILAQAFGG